MVRRALANPAQPLARSRSWLLALLLAALPPLLLSGCGGSGPRVADAFYSLQPALVQEPTGADLTRTGTGQGVGTLQVSPWSARGFLGGTQIVFRTAAEPLQTQRYDHFMWDQPPARALAAALAVGLRASGTFAFVLGGAERAQADFVLIGDLTRLEHLPTNTPPRVAAAWTLTLIDARTRRARFSQTYAGEEPTAASTPAAMVAAFDRLTGRLLSAAVADLKRLDLGAAATRAHPAH